MSLYYLMCSAAGAIGASIVIALDGWWVGWWLGFWVSVFLYGLATLTFRMDERRRRDRADA